MNHAVAFVNRIPEMSRASLGMHTNVIAGFEAFLGPFG